MTHTHGMHNTTEYLAWKNIKQRCLNKNSDVNKWRHGTRTGYDKHKCKCDECCASNTERHRKRRAMKKGLTN